MNEIDKQIQETEAKLAKLMKAKAIMTHKAEVAIDPSQIPDDVKIKRFDVLHNTITNILQETSKDGYYDEDNVHYIFEEAVSQCLTLPNNMGTRRQVWDFWNKVVDGE